MRPAYRIDVQHHILPPDYVAAVGKRAIGDLIVSGTLPAWTPQVSIDAMDRNGIELAVTSLSAPSFHHDDETSASKLARACNEYAADLVGTYKGRFGMFATLPLPHVDAAVDEIAFCLGVLGADGVCLLSNYGEAYLGDPAFAPVFEELNRRRAVVFVHPAEAAGPRLLPHIPAATLEFPFATSRAIVNMLYSGTLTRTRDARFIFSHAGGTVPFLADRIGRLQRRPDLARHVPDGPMAELERLYFDTALSASPRIFNSLSRLVGMRQVLFASDYPHAPEETMTATIAGLGGLGLDEDDLRSIERENALALIPGLFGRRNSDGSGQ